MYSIKEITKLSQKKYRDEMGAYIIEGEKGVLEAIEMNMPVQAIFASEEQATKHELFNNPLLRIVNKIDAKKISDTDTFSGILAVVKKVSMPFDEGHIICLDRVADPGNLGTIIRTADWFGIHNILLSEACVDPHNPKVVRSTMGSFFRANIQESIDIISDLESYRSQGYELVSLTMDGKPLHELNVSSPTIFIFGSESHGVRPEIQLITQQFTIPKKGNAESLNVAIAAGITLSRV